MYPERVVDKVGEVVVRYEVSHFEYPDNEVDPDREKLYDVSASNELESDEWFSSVDEAEDWVKRMLGG